MKLLTLLFGLLLGSPALAQEQVYSPLQAGGTISGNLIINGAIKSDIACPLPAIINANPVYAHVCIQSAGVTNFANSQMGVVISYTSTANTLVGQNESVALFPTVTANAGSPPAWALAAEVYSLPLSGGMKVVEIDDANTDCDTGPLNALYAGCNKIVVNLLIDGIGRGTPVLQASGTGSITGTTLTWTNTSGAVVAGGIVIGSGVATSTQILAFGTNGTTGTGGTGTYALSGNSQTIASEAMTVKTGSYPSAAAIDITDAGLPQFYDGVVFTGTNAIINHAIMDLSSSPVTIFVASPKTNVIDMHTTTTCSGPCILMAQGQDIAFDSSGVNADIAYDGTSTNLKGDVTTGGFLVVKKNAGGATTIPEMGSGFNSGIAWNQSGGGQEFDIYSAGGISFYAMAGTTIGSAFWKTTAAGLETMTGEVSGGTKFTASGCSNNTLVGGATAGSYKSGTTGTCTVTLTMNGATGLTAPNGWTCDAHDTTTPADVQNQTAFTPTTATISGTTVSGDVVAFKCMGF